MKDDAVQTSLKVMNPLPTCMARFWRQKICQMAVQICITLKKKWQLSITRDMGLSRSSRKCVVHTNVFSGSWHHEGILDQAQPCSILSVYM